MKRIAAVLAAVLLLAACEANLITTPEDGAIVPDSTVTVTGVLPDNVPTGGTIKVNGIAGT